MACLSFGIAEPSFNLIPVIAAVGALISFAIGFDVVFAIFVSAPKLAPVAVVGVIVAATRIRIERLAAPQVLAGYRHTIAKTELTRFVHAITKAVAAIITIFVTVIIAIIGAVLVTVIVIVVVA